jgi:pimeloyl-ACP methyl ester carboxylesterase
MYDHKNDPIPPNDRWKTKQGRFLLHYAQLEYGRTALSSIWGLLAAYLAHFFVSWPLALATGLLIICLHDFILRRLLNHYGLTAHVTYSRLRVILSRIILVITVLFLIAYFVLGWIVADKLTAVDPQKVLYDQTITAISGNSYTVKGSAYSVPGVIGGIRDDGSMIGIFSKPQQNSDTDTTSTRTLDMLVNDLSVGQHISLQGNIWTSNPESALGFPYKDVTYKSTLGDMHAWLIQPELTEDNPTSTWTIGVHGINADKTEMLRFIKPVVAINSNMLVVNYRNDSNNPGSTDQRNHLSDTEWQDLEAAVQYAKEQGATTINLYGDSLGGSIVENYLRRSTDTEHRSIAHVVLDSPALDWNAVIKAQITNAGYPGILSYPASTVLKMKFGIDISTISTTASDIKYKTLIIHNPKDKTVPQAASKEIADSRPDSVTLLDLGDGGHLRSWNYDQDQYERRVTDFLSH